jgi:cytochrome P450
MPIPYGEKQTASRHRRVYAVRLCTLNARPPLARAVLAILLNAGTDTTRNKLAAAVEVLSDYPDQWALHPELAPRAVEEVMRHFPIVFSTLRVAIEDVELGDVRIPAATFVVANTAAANRDPVVYDDPDRLDITREGPPPMLTFGGGVHYCLGSHLARLELAEALRVITRRMPNPRRTGAVPWRPIIGISGPTIASHRIRTRGLTRRNQESRTSIGQVGPCACASRASNVSSVASNASANAT